jgi:hypothetical protein
MLLMHLLLIANRVNCHQQLARSAQQSKPSSQQGRVPADYHHVTNKLGLLASASEPSASTMWMCQAFTCVLRCPHLNLHLKLTHAPALQPATGLHWQLLLPCKRCCPCRHCCPSSCCCCCCFVCCCGSSITVQLYVLATCASRLS